MRQVTIRATTRQVDRWEEMGRVFLCKRDVRHFIIFAADLTARRFRERERQRAIPDPISRRLYEKYLLGRLLEAARKAVDHLPPHVDGTLYGRAYPRRELRDAIDGVQHFLAETEEEYGPCP